ncbi:MAG: hypothetical protein CVU44_21580 [Chloroflexi bacterium HGW-Chloroflexi-6]|nr:MAG: hypothetical protein CVU44_21580 [Chloroflexi bacterium HGW-Chloroflexi-6]
MDTIKFVIEDYIDAEAGFRCPVINIYINDHNLIDLVRQIETRGRVQEQEENARWPYIGFEKPNFRRFYDEMLGMKIYPRSVLLTCTCTYELCNCIMADIVFGADTVTWSDLKSPWLGGKTPSPWVDEDDAQELEWQPIDYSRLGPFSFDRAQYLAALEKMTQEWHLQNKDAGA